IPASLIAVFTLAPMTAACGGKVVVDAPSGQGGQGGGASQAGPLCAAWCDARAAAGCPSPHQDQCAAGCATRIGYEGVCGSIAMASLTCWSKVSADQICAGKSCDEEQAQLEACVHPPGDCAAGECTSEVGGLHCKTICGDNVYETTCAAS